MSAPVRPDPPLRMTADEFLAWAMEADCGRHELVDGAVVAMAPERAGHARTKLEVTIALRRAVALAGVGCEAMIEGMGIRVSDDTVFEPDALVRCGPPLPDDALIVPDALVVVEVLSPSTRYVDSGRKLIGYFQVPSVQHYLVVDGVNRIVVHHRRAGAEIMTRILHAAAGATLSLDPPGLTLPVAELFDAA